MIFTWCETADIHRNLRETKRGWGFGFPQFLIKERDLWKTKGTCGKPKGPVENQRDLWKPKGTCGKPKGPVENPRDLWKPKGTCGKPKGPVENPRDLWKTKENLYIYIYIYIYVHALSIETTQNHKQPKTATPKQTENCLWFSVCLGVAVLGCLWFWVVSMR